METNKILDCNPDMSQVSITQLPQAQALTGTESVPIVQFGVTVQTTTSAISGAGALNYPFLTVGQTVGLTQSRYISTNSGLTLTDNGAQGTLQINLIGAAMSLNSSGTGIQVKTGSNTLTARSLAVGAGLGVTNSDGVSGNPTISLGSMLQQFVSLTGTGILALQSGSPAKIELQGTTSQISILNGNGATDPVISLASNPVVPGNGSITVPNGTSVQRTGSFGAVRYNTSLQQFEGYTSTGWNQFSLTGGVTSFSAGITGFSPNIDTTGAVTLSGILNVGSGGTGATTLTGYVYGNGTSLMTASTTIPTTALSGTITNAQLANSAITINGTSVSLGSSTNVGTVTSVTGTSPVVSSGGTTPTISMPAATGSVNGYLTSTDWTTFNNKGSGTVTSVTGTSPVVSSGGATPAISMPAATTSVSGYLTSTDWNAFNNKQPSGTYVTSVSGTTGQITSTGGTAPVINLTSGIATAGTTGSATLIPVVTIDTYGRVTSITTAANPQGTVTSVSGTGTVNGITLTGTVTSSGSLTLGGTLGGIANSQLTNSSITINGSSVSLGGSVTVTATASAALTIGTGLSGTSYNGSTAVTIANTGVLSLSGGTTGLTPATATTGVITLAGTLVVGNGGTGVATLTGLAYGNGTSAFTAATAAQVVSVIGSTAVTNATNATNTAITASSSGATNYLTFVTATSGNLPQLVNSAITANAVNGTITGGIAGGAF
jgi:hypothetical protein